MITKVRIGLTLAGIPLVFLGLTLLGNGGIGGLIFGIGFGCLMLAWQAGKEPPAS